MNNKPYLTTQANFKEFMRECEFWIDFFGLKEWDIHFRHDGSKDCYACAYPDCSSRVAIVNLSPDWSETKPTLPRIRKYAFHEVCEVMLYKLSRFPIEEIRKKLNMKQKSNKQFIKTLEDETEEIKHILLGLFENTIWKPMYVKRFKRKIKPEE